MKATNLPWWLEAAENACSTCLQGYAYHLELRCVDCDRALCPQCVVRISGETELRLCPDCAPRHQGKKTKTRPL